MPETFSATTRSITVSVNAIFLEDQSEPDENQYVWAYRVEIHNSGTDAVQILSRHWKITDGRGQVVEVKGAGVVGEQPVIEPGDTFQYTSGTPLSTSSGFMQGTYHVSSLPSGESFDVQVPTFSLDTPNGRGRLH